MEGWSQQLRRARRQPECRGGQLLVQSTLNGEGGGKYWGLAELVEPWRGGHNTLDRPTIFLWLLVSTLAPNYSGFVVRAAIPRAPIVQANRAVKNRPLSRDRTAAINTC